MATIDEFTDKTTMMVATGDQSTPSLIVTQPLHFYPVVRKEDGEIYVGIMCACLPACRQFFSHVLPRWLGKSVADSSAAPSRDTANTTPSRNKTPKSASRPIISTTSFADRSKQGFTELDDLVDSLPMQGTRTGDTKFRTETTDRSWFDNEREGSDRSASASTKQWS